MISDVYFPRINGVSTSIQSFRRELQRQGHQVTLMVPDYGHHDADDAQLVRVAGWRLPFDPEDRLMRPRALRRALDGLTRRFDLVHIQTPFAAHYAGLAYARRQRLPVVASYHTFFEEYLFHYIPLLPRRALRWAARRFTRSQCNRVDALVVPSNAMLAVLRAYGVATPAAVIPTGIPALSAVTDDGEAFRARHGLPSGRPTLIHVGRLAFEKNIDFLLRVVQQLTETVPEVLLVIAGEGPARTALQRQSRALGIEANVRFIGYLERERELPHCYRCGDAFIFASRTETQGLVLLEAMAHGLPVVSTAVMGTRDIIEPQRGALHAPEQVAGFSAQVARLLGDKRLRHRLAAEGIAFAAEWSLPQLGQRLAAWYRDSDDRYRGDGIGDKGGDEVADSGQRRSTGGHPIGVKRSDPGLPTSGGTAQGGMDSQAGARQPGKP